MCTLVVKTILLEPVPLMCGEGFSLTVEVGARSQKTLIYRSNTEVGDVTFAS